MNLRELIDEVDVPVTRVAEGTWETARGRVRRRRVVTTAGAALAVATVVVAVSLLPDGQRTDGPVDSPTPSPTVRAGEMVVTVPDWAALVVNRVPNPTADADPLSENPVDRASLVMADPSDDAGAFVLGDDGDWRRLDVDGLEPVRHGSYVRALVRSTSLDETATRLAIPQPDGLVVVDLTTGTAERYDVAGEHTYAIWHDASHVLVAGESGDTGTLVDLDTGAVEPATYGTTSRVRPDGPALTWGWGGGSTLRWDDREVETPANNDGGFFPQPPLVSGAGDLVVGLHGMGRPSADPDSLLATHNGVVAVGGESGDILGFLQLDTGKGNASALLGWAGDLPVLGLVRAEDNAFQTRVVTWDYRSGELHPLAVLPSWFVAWGVGL